MDNKVIGSATHLVISKLDLTRPLTVEAVAGLVEKLAKEGAITQPLVSEIPVGSIAKFFQTELGQMALDENNSVWREWPFTFTIPASQWLQLDHETQNPTPKTHDRIIVQGIIDLLIKTPKGLIVIDFKTDNVSSAQVSRRAEFYRRQLDLYGRAASAITGQQVLSKWLYFLRLAFATEV